MSTSSAIFEGSVVHQRHLPVEHRFRYSMAQLYLDLDEIPELFHRLPMISQRPLTPLWFRERDYLPERMTTLGEAVRTRVYEETGEKLDGPVRLLAHVRTMGHVFNPVSFFYCFDRDQNLRAVVAEITNTPWKERHCYIIASPANVVADEVQRDFPKEFHVSPFMGMDHQYRWTFSSPREQLRVHMTNFREGSAVFEASLHLQRRNFDNRGLARVLLRYPLMTARIVAAIHWQAFRLWRKRVPFHSHPAKRAASRALVTPERSP